MGAAVLDREGYRPNVGIILVNGRNEVFWGKRIREHAWQFPQGGIKRGESPQQAMFRELILSLAVSDESELLVYTSMFGIFDKSYSVSVSSSENIEYFVPISFPMNEVSIVRSVFNTDNFITSSRS